jgi:hypothetical protein
MGTIVGKRGLMAWAVAVTAVVITGCSDDERTTGTVAPLPSSSLPATAPVTTQAPTTIAAPVTTAGPATTASVTSPPTLPATDPSTLAPASTVAPPTTEACVAPTGFDTFEDGFPMRLSSLVGVDIRTGAHACFERVVVEFGGTGDMPGVRVEYVDDPVLLSPSDMTVEVAGEATLIVAFGAWMPSIDGDGYAGPTDVAPTNVAHVLQLRQVENFEGMAAWAIGLDVARPYRVDLLDGPPRIVIDIASG